MPQRRLKPRPSPPTKPEPRILRCVVVGKSRVLGRSVGEYVELPEEQAKRLVSGGHVELAPETPPKPKPSPKPGPKAFKKAAPAAKAETEME